MKKLLFVSSLVLLLFPKVTLSHCPLCTAGAGALAILAASLGVSSIVIGVMVGAFSLALALWLKNIWPKKEYILLQKKIIALLIFLGTVIPISPLIREYGPFYVPFLGQYGTTYALNLYYFGVSLGALTLWFAPYVSRLVTKFRGGNVLPYQGITITFVLLIFLSAIIQFLS